MDSPVRQIRFLWFIYQGPWAHPFILAGMAGEQKLSIWAKLSLSRFVISWEPRVPGVFSPLPESQRPLISPAMAEAQWALFTFFTYDLGKPWNMRPSLLIRYMCWEPHFCGVCRPRPYAGAYSDQWPLLESRFTEKPLTWPFWGEWSWVSSLCINKLNKFLNWNPQPAHPSPSSTILTPSIHLLPLILKCLCQCLLHHLALLWLLYCLSKPFIVPHWFLLESSGIQKFWRNVFFAGGASQTGVRILEDSGRMQTRIDTGITRTEWTGMEFARIYIIC